MNEAAFVEAREEIEKSAIPVTEAVYSASTFGSWYLVAGKEPAWRLVWDGREELFVVEQRTEQMFNGLPAWKEVWLARGASVENLRAGIRRLMEEAGKGAG